MGRRITALGWALLALGAYAGVAAAQAPDSQTAGETNAANVVSYPAEFFAGSGANTALDLVKRTPGFSYNPGQANVRGLAGAAGNVLIDGQAQTSKSITLDDALTRISTAQVERIDLVRGATGGIDMGGFPVVANVIRKAGAESRITTQLTGRVFRNEAHPDYGARAEWSRRAGDLQLAATLDASDRNADDNAPGGYGPLVREYVSGAIDQGPYLTTNRNKALTANGSAEYRSGPARYRANIGFEYRGNDRAESTFVTVPEFFLSDEDTWEVELGANAERTLNPWLTARIDVLQTMQKTEKTSGRVGRLSPSSANSGESILRGSVGLRRWSNLSFEFAAEGAFNFLEQESALGFANANVRVEERRVQPSVTMNWHVFEPLALELGARRESSTISQSGDTNSEHTFNFFKPRAIAVFDVLDATQLRVRVEREVSQLIFADFVASSGSQDNQAVAGNSEREPERAWTYEAAIEQRLWARSVLVLTATHQEVEQVVDNIPIGLSSEGNGNIGDGVRDTYAMDLKVALDPLGIRGGRLELLPKYTISQATDPFTGERRTISGIQQWGGRINLYLDRPEWKSTFALEGAIGFLFRDYRRDQVTRSVQPIYVTAWWERTFRPGASLRASIFNVGGRERIRRRDVYLGARPNAPLSFRENRIVKRGSGFQLTLRQTY